MKMVTLGSTGITVPQNAFGALPIQRDDLNTAVSLLRRAYEGGMRFFDTARAYTDSEEKIGVALSDVRSDLYLATKSGATTPDGLKRDLETSLRLLKTDYVDLYQLHNAAQCYKPGDGTGVYECMEEFKRQGMIRHISVTCHKIMVAEECIQSGLYETMQFPFSYLSGPREIQLARSCAEHNMGFIAMKGLAGGLINNSRAAYSFIAQYDNVLPIWGIQRPHELEEWLSYMDNPPALDTELQALIAKDKAEFGQDFCRSCGYCMPCPQEIIINQCARMSQLLRRAPSKEWLSPQWQKEMDKITTCLECGSCKAKCPYELDTPALLKKNYADYQRVLRGETKVD